MFRTEELEQSDIIESCSPIIHSIVMGSLKLLLYRTTTDEWLHYGLKYLVDSCQEEMMRVPMNAK